MTTDIINLPEDGGVGVREKSSSCPDPFTCPLRFVERSREGPVGGRCPGHDADHIEIGLPSDAGDADGLTDEFTSTVKTGYNVTACPQCLGFDGAEGAGSQAAVEFLSDHWEVLSWQFVSSAFSVDSLEELSSDE